MRARVVLVDTHAHLNSSEFDADRTAVLERARAAGVQCCLCPGVDLASSRAAVELARAGAGMLAAVGVHPHEARSYDDATENALAALLALPGVVAVGETGLDYHYDHSPREVQRQALRRQLRLARSRALPVVVHNRDSAEDISRILDEEGRDLRIVLHAFGGEPALIDLGRRLELFYGIGGFLTFRKHPLADRVHELPRQSLLLETDSPYLSPHPVRGRRNEPARVEIVARRLGEILGIDLAEVAELTTRNFQRFVEGR